MENESNLRAYLVVTALVFLMLVALAFVFLFVLIAGIILSPVIVQIMFNVFKNDKFILIKHWTNLIEVCQSSLFYVV